MKCPKCGLINAPTAERCDCGFGFADGSVVAPVVSTVPGARLRHSGCAVAIIAFLLAVVAKRVGASSGLLLLGVAADLLMVVVFLAFAAWVIGALRMRKARS
jgi:hypothetical protein